VLESGAEELAEALAPEVADGVHHDHDGRPSGESHDPGRPVPPWNVKNL